MRIIVISDFKRSLKSYLIFPVTFSWKIFSNAHDSLHKSPQYPQLINYRTVQSPRDATGFVNWLRDLIKYLEGETTWRKWKLTIDVSRNALGIRNGTFIRDDLPSHRCFLPRNPRPNIEIFNSILRNASICQSWLESDLRDRTESETVFNA